MSSAVEIDTVHPRATRLSVRGELDLSAVAAFAEVLRRAIRAGGRVEIDLDRVEFIDGRGLSMLMDAERRAPRRVTIVAASACVRRLIDITDTAHRVPELTGAASTPR
jgi:anti-anti-sigma factor